MDYDIHHFELHTHCHKMPILQRKTLEFVRANFQPNDNPLRTIDNLIIALNRAAYCKEILYEEQKLAYFAIKCLTKQIPFIEFGMVKPKR